MPQMTLHGSNQQQEYWNGSDTIVTAEKRTFAPVATGVRDA